MRIPRVRQLAPEVLLALVLFGAVLGEYHDLLSVPVVAASILVAFPLIARLVWPFPTVVAVTVGTAWLAHAISVSGNDFPTVEVIALGFALWAVGSRSSWPVMVASAVVALTGWTLTVLSLAASAGRIAVGALFVGCGLLIGRAMGVLQFESDSFAEQTALLTRERDERAELAVREERRRIARELHDVISNSVSVMGVQAGAVRTVLRPEQHREAQALRQVEQTGRETIAELKRLLGLLRNDPADAALSPQGLARAHHLIDQLRGAGLDVTLQLSGDLADIPAGLDLAVFRILQEALTNALKHAPAATTTATLTRTRDCLQVRVIDDGRGAAATSTAMSTAAGYGLHGMRERASLYGGQLHAAPRAGGGFEILATFPLNELP